MIKNKIPNYLTILRILLWIPLLFCLTWFYYHSKNTTVYIKNKYYFVFVIALIVFVIAMFTDFLDGFLARKFKAISTFGQLFDPLSDKIIVSTILIFLALLKFSEIWIVVIFIVRDIMVDGFRNLAAKYNKKVAASVWGKLKTLSQTFAIILLMVLMPILDENNKQYKLYYWILNIPMFCALFFSIFSGILYFKEIKNLVYFKNKQV
ncbi:CDP-diacylglycerol--glycerol-3-phosphate 3-phosphatidyltransferase [Mesomycoplasma neurolyticum]|uniref:CDP-diacylglycerol--glycerol-3-phosphate 3-phosphatidyltransferase n=1 Tax=Mesomycoplasma neurolyticum TaxID=2120 RepID=A0A449A564_9BACT|nr:CDP-diacylglycerol--glycerol-3-phosphate 3-phosphatidyltransferase [Mesomycoplasma neurolyticum]VEU59369.1 CDP-diacylglycerol--glycerol-3-phosphate 3-phosphatidyltransferase [Mesomycoplasma neurolyticum]